MEPRLQSHHNVILMRSTQKSLEAEADENLNLENEKKEISWLYKGNYDVKIIINIFNYSQCVIAALKVKFSVFDCEFRPYISNHMLPCPLFSVQFPIHSDYIFT